MLSHGKRKRKIGYTLVRVESRVQTKEGGMGFKSMGERKWKQELIYNTFSATNATQILHIPLAAEAHDDWLVWGDESSGEFSVKSAYKLL